MKMIAKLVCFASLIVSLVGFGYCWGIQRAESAPARISVSSPMVINCFKVDDGFVQYCVVDDWTAKALRTAVAKGQLKP